MSRFWRRKQQQEDPWTLLSQAYRALCFSYHGCPDECSGPDHYCLHCMTAKRIGEAFEARGMTPLEVFPDWRQCVDL